MRFARFGVLVLAMGCGGGDDGGGAGTDGQATDGGGGTTVAGTGDCSDPSVNPFAGTCVESYLAGCFDPDGPCTYEQTGMGVGTNITWDNGASVSTTMSGMTGTTTLTSSTGTVCATGTSEVMADGCAAKTTYQRPDGELQVWCFQQDGSFTVTCDDGTVISVTPDQADGMGSCQYGSSEQCTPA